MKKQKLTPWIDGGKFVPFHVGEYNASFVRNKDTLRWWNGCEWSSSYREKDDEYFKKERRSKTVDKSIIRILDIDFRGLAVKP